MADEAKNEQVTDETGSEKTVEPTKQAEDKKPEPISEFDTSKLTDEQFESIFKDQRLFTHPRFKSLNEKAKQAEALEKERAEAETKALEEQKKFQELYEKEKAEKTELENKVRQQAIASAISSEAVKKGVVDLEAAIKLADASGIDIDKDGNVTGADQAVAKLLENKPYLIGKEPEKAIGEGTNPGKNTTEAGTKKFKLSQIQDHSFYKENEAEIRQAWKLGLIEDDTAQ